ncbi:uncharacterized protein [Dysidea avara]|uniref:uncharacterized protein n=1 Tax=Dysidea avara TaxID=196820 RepID=UPI0033226B12
MAQMLKALTQRMKRHQLNDYPNQVKPAPASETVDTVEGTSSSSDSEEEQEKSPTKQGVKHAEKRRHLKNTSCSSSSDEELRDLHKKPKVYCQPGQCHSLPPLYARKRVKILPASKAASINRPCIDFYKMQSSRRIPMVKRPIHRIKPVTHHSFAPYSRGVQLELPKPMMDRFKPVVQT